jgi:hypothetical protein
MLQQTRTVLDPPKGNCYLTIFRWEPGFDGSGSGSGFGSAASTRYMIYISAPVKIEARIFLFDRKFPITIIGAEILPT